MGFVLANLQSSLAQASQLHREGRLAEAEPLYRKVLARDPSHFDALYGLGLLAFQAGHGDDAIELAVAALKVRPNAPNVLANSAAILLDTNRFGDALAACERLLAITPTDPDALLKREIALQSLGRGPEAIEGFRKVLALRPDFTPAALNLGLPSPARAGMTKRWQPSTAC